MCSALPQRPDRGWRVTTDDAMDYAACIIGAPAGLQESVIVTLAAEVRRLREVERKFASALPAWKAEEVVWRETEADLLRDLAALRQRHAKLREVLATLAVDGPA